MSEFENYTEAVVEDWDGTRVGRVEGVISGVAFGAMVPLGMIGDRAACEAQLRAVAEQFFAADG